MKKGQITVFIILGIVILAVVALVLYARHIGIGIDPENFLQKKGGDVKQDVAKCLNEIGNEAIFTIGKQGGTLYPVKYRLYKGYNVNYLCTNIPDDPRCMNMMLTLDDLEKEITKHVKDNLDGCIDIDVGYYDVQKGEKQVDVTIAENNVLIKLDYPLTLTKGSTVKQVKEFSNVVNVPLGKVYNTAVEIINSEALFADFDPLPYMLVHRDILIERDKPYPDKVYNLIDDSGYEFMFAIEGEEA